jgi:predicted Zn-ribbon and HTH transcriptional regulator
MPQKESIPEQRHDTLRHEILTLLSGRQLSVADISAEIGKSEKELYDHLENLMKYKSVEMIPARCLNCGFVFRERSRARKPGKCPRCKKTRIGQPLFTYTAED